MSDECRFELSFQPFCLEHGNPDPVSGGYKVGADPALCFFGKDALQAQVAHLQTVADDVVKSWGIERDANRRLEADVAAMREALSALVRETEDFHFTLP